MNGRLWILCVGLLLTLIRAAGIVNPTSLSFTSKGRLLITPGCYEFDAS